MLPQSLYTKLFHLQIKCYKPTKEKNKFVFGLYLNHILVTLFVKVKINIKLFIHLRIVHLLGLAT